MSAYPTIDLASVASDARSAAEAANPDAALMGNAAVTMLVVTATVLAFAAIAHLRGATRPARVLAGIGIAGVLAACALALPARDMMTSSVPTLAEVCADEWGIDIIAADGTVDSGRIDVAGDPVTSVADLAPLSFESRWHEGDDIRFGRLTLSETGELTLEAYPENDS